MKNLRIGVCAKPGDVAQVARAGFDYIELDLNDVLALSEDAYRAMAADMAEHALYAEVVSGMLPPGVEIVGPAVVAKRIHEALDRSFDLAQALGAEYMLLDCESARKLPEGFDPAQAWRQFGNFVRILQTYAVRFGVNVALLPLRRSAADLMNYASEAALICAMLQLDRVGVAISSYNMALESDSLPRLRRVGSLLWHVRTSNVLGNLPPKPGDGEDYEKLFRLLREMNYSGRVSCEAPCASFGKDAAVALETLRVAEAEAWGE